MVKYDECIKCGALTERLAKHKRWHRELEERLDDLTSQIEDLETR